MMKRRGIVAVRILNRQSRYLGSILSCAQPFFEIHYFQVFFVLNALRLNAVMILNLIEDLNRNILFIVYKAVTVFNELIHCT